MKLRDKLKLEGIKQVDLAKELNTTKQSISDIMAGRNNNKKLIRRVSEFVGFDINEYDRT